MKTTAKTKRRKVWVNEYEHELGSIAWHVRREAAKKREDVTGTIAFVEAHPGDVVLSRETKARVRSAVEWAHSHLNSRYGPTDVIVVELKKALALLRGGR